MTDVGPGEVVTLQPYSEVRGRRVMSTLVTVEHHGYQSSTIVTARANAARAAAADRAADRLLENARGLCRTIGPSWREDPIDVTYDGSCCPNDLT